MSDRNTWWTEVYDGQANERTAKRVAKLEKVLEAAIAAVDFKFKEIRPGDGFSDGVIAAPDRLMRDLRAAIAEANDD